MTDFICEVCGTRFTAKKDLDKHREKQHAEAKGGRPDEPMGKNIGKQSDNPRGEGSEPIQEEGSGLEAPREIPQESRTKK
jgi:uncharacterized C2H2 Zn-finger protein